MGYGAKLSVGVFCNLALALTQFVHGEGLPAPSDAVVLTITGEIEHPNVGDEMHLDMAALESLPAVTYSTETPSHDQHENFTGVRINTLLEAIGSDAREIMAIGLDDYKFTLADLDFERYPIIIAYRQDGEYISVRNLGPLRIIIPISEHPELNTPINESRAVWQLVALELL